MKIARISDIIPQVIDRARGAPEPRDLCWIVMGGEFCYADYCPECAEIIIDWLRDGEEKPEFDEHEEFPTSASVEREDNYFNREGGHEFDGCRHCEHCGHHLNVSLSEYGVLSELDHFEDWGLKSAEDWRHFLDVCGSVFFIGEGMLHERTLALASKHLI